MQILGLCTGFLSVFFEKNCNLIFRKWGGRSKAVWIFSAITSVLVAPPVPYSNHANVGQILGHGPPSGNKQMEFWWLTKEMNCFYSRAEQTESWWHLTQLCLDKHCHNLGLRILLWLYLNQRYLFTYPKGLRAKSTRAVTGKWCPHSGLGKNLLSKIRSYKQVIDEVRGPKAKNGFSGRNTKLWAQKKRPLFDGHHVLAMTGQSCANKKVPSKRILGVFFLGKNRFSAKKALFSKM